MPLRTRTNVAKTPKIGRGSPRPAERRSEPPLHSKKVPATAGKNEPPPSTNVAIVTELTMDGDWVRRTPSALLILPPPPQFADPEPPPSHPSPLPSKPPKPASLPSRSHTAAPAMRLSRSHTAAPATRLARPHALETKAATTPTSRAKVACTSYATAAATPTHTTIAPQTDNTQAPPPAQQPTLPTIVVKCFPTWIGHFRIIAEALGHAPNARPYKEGVKFEPKSEKELWTIRRRLEEAAASDAISYYEIPEFTAEEKKTPPTQPIATPQDATPLPATAELGDDAPPTTIPAVPAASDETQAGTITHESEVPLSRRRSRKRAPRPTYHSPVADAARRSPLLPTPTAGYAPMKAREPYHDRHYNNNYKAPSSLDRAVRVILEALTTGIAAYLREQGAMPAPQHPTYHRAQSHDWRARAGEIPAKTHSPGK